LEWSAQIEAYKYKSSILTKYQQVPTDDEVEVQE
jgi:hypothetical protein